MVIQSEIRRSLNRKLSNLPICVKPPHPPWVPFKTSKMTSGYLSFYYSDDLSPLPIRWVTKPGDNKSDPNLETGTYGLFSTCSRDMRVGVVKNKAPYIFFFAPRKGIRVVSGYYHIGWYTESVFGKRDYCLAADHMHFMRDPIPLPEIDKLIKTNYSSGFRLRKFMSALECAKLKVLLDSFPDISIECIDEINRLERFNLKYGGYRYVAWRQLEKFSWDYAKRYLTKINDDATQPIISNSSPTNLWKCINCKEVVNNRALLKLCPFCKKPGTLQPVKDNLE